MSQSLNKFRFQVRLDPVLSLLLAGTAPLSLTAFLTLEEGWLGIALAWVALCELLGRAAERGWLPGLSRSLTPNFYAVRAWNGAWSVFQRRPVRRKGAECGDLLSGLVREQLLLPEALEPGCYQAVTHDVVLRRLKAMQGAEIRELRPVYRGSMDGIIRRMAGRCRSCKKACPFPETRKRSRQFYLVKFVVMARNDTGKGG